MEGAVTQQLNVRRPPLSDLTSRMRGAAGRCVRCYLDNRRVPRADATATKAAAVKKAPPLDSIPSGDAAPLDDDGADGDDDEEKTKAKEETAKYVRTGLRGSPWRSDGAQRSSCLIDFFVVGH